MGRKRALLMGAAIAVCLAGAGILAESFERPAALHDANPVRPARMAGAVQEPVVLATICVFESAKQAVIRLAGF